jgi:hypothetical protein
LAFPDYEDFPALISQFAKVPLVAFYISLPLCLPELSIGRRCYPAVSAFVHMPEAAVYKDDLSMPSQNHIRIARQILVKESLIVDYNFEA